MIRTSYSRPGGQPGGVYTVADGERKLDGLSFDEYLTYIDDYKHHPPAEAFKRAQERHLAVTG
jgi:hypothetical protein